MFEIKNVLPIVMFLVIFFSDFLTIQYGILPKIFFFLPDAFAFGIAVFVIPRIIARKSFKIPIKYLLLFFAFVYVVISGIILNEISAETIIAGIRSYFKYIFIFLLPLAYDYSGADLVKQFKVLIILGLLQIPVSFIERFVLHVDKGSGDIITGTLAKSTSLTIMMIGFILMFLALYLRKNIPIKTLLLLSFLFFLPTTINETKSTVILLPAGLAGLFFVMYKEISKKQITIIIGSGVLLLGLYVVLYDALYSTTDDAGFIDMMIGERGMVQGGGYNLSGFQVDPNVITNIQEKVVGEYKDLPEEDKKLLGRFDTFYIPLQVYLSKESDISQSLFGFGVGNATSLFGKGATYKHIRRLQGGHTTLSLFLWETGIIGVFLFVMFLIFILWDTLVLTRESGVWGVFACGWFGILIVTLATLPYYTMFYFPEISFLFMFFSGVVVFYRSTNVVSENGSQYMIRNK